MSYMINNNDTIVAIATAQGKGSVGIVRISGKLAKKIGLILSKQIDLKPRYAYYGSWFNQQDQIIDQGILIYFAAPNSFTGEDIIELQGHGGPVVLDLLLELTNLCRSSYRLSGRRNRFLN